MTMQDAVRIWRAGPEFLDRATAPGMEAKLAEWRSMLSVIEQRRADAFHAEEHRRSYVVAHTALRVVLGSLTGETPARLRILAEDGAKPALMTGEDGGGIRHDLRFSLSHTRGAVMIAVAAAREIGVDVERQRSIHDLEGMAEAVMSAEELACWRRLPPQARETAFYRVWTRKESYLKAIGLGLFRDLHEVTTPGVPGMLEEPSAVEDRSSEGTWLVRDLAVWESFSAAICWQGDDRMRVEVEDLRLEELV